MAAQEFDGMKEQLDLEQSLRVQAETFAHEVRNAVFLLARAACPGGHVIRESRDLLYSVVCKVFVLAVAPCCVCSPQPSM